MDLFRVQLSNTNALLHLTQLTLGRFYHGRMICQALRKYIILYVVVKHLAVKLYCCSPFQNCKREMLHSTVKEAYCIYRVKKTHSPSNVV